MAKKSRKSRKRKTSESQDRAAWWREARFGLFIHWGLYAVPAGTWKGKRIPGLGEWIMYHAKIPAQEYEKLAAQFNPVDFDADAVVRLARDAGMKYLVITAKHHDGFAMYDSPSSDYDIVDATPYGRDIMKDLAEACRTYGVKLCFYYSQDQDWHESGATGNTWDWREPSDEAFEDYLDGKVAPQVKELLTQYGPIGLIWFDTPFRINRKQSLRLKRLVHRLQPDCLVSGRVGNEVGDYGSMGDNQIPAGPVEGDWETPATLNDTWGYKSYDRNWKSVKTLLTLLVDLASKGVNYLLNIGPRADGRIPAASVKRLEAIGEWMDVNGEAIYATQPNPYPYELPWGRITRKPGKLYLHLYKWSRRLTLYGLRSKVERAYLLCDKRRSVEFSQTADEDSERHALRLSLPAGKPDPHISVVVVEHAGELDVDTRCMQLPEGGVDLPAHMAELPEGLSLARGGYVQDWHNKKHRVRWDFLLFEPGTYEVKAVLSVPRKPEPCGHVLKVRSDRQRVRGRLDAKNLVESPRSEYHPESETTLGTVTFDEPGLKSLTAQAEKIGKSFRRGVSLVRVELHPVE